jgi:hypothetical protein
LIELDLSTIVDAFPPTENRFTENRFTPIRAGRKEKSALLEHEGDAATLAGRPFSAKSARREWLAREDFEASGREFSERIRRS